MAKRLPPQPKFRTSCQSCGERSPRPTTDFTQAKWMKQHVRDHATAAEKWGECPHGYVVTCLHAACRARRDPLLRNKEI